MERVYYSDDDERTKEIRKKFKQMTKEEIIEEYFDLKEQEQDSIYNSMGDDL